MPADPDTVLRRLTDRLAPLERDLHRALWAATTEARPETSAARQRAEEAWLAALGDPELFAEVQEAAVAADRTAGAGGQPTGGPWSRPAWTCWPTRSPRATGPS